MSNSEFGIHVLHSSHNTCISGNYITNTGLGIELYSSNYNVIYENNIVNNNWGITIADSFYNKLCHNNLVDNGPWYIDPPCQVSIEPGLTATWDDGYPAGGNYWSDYVGVDVKSGPDQDLHGSDGIGDTSYVVDANNVDHYPLMNPYGAPPPPAYALTITTTIGGTADPPPGIYSYTTNSSIQVTAIPNPNFLYLL